MLIIYTILTIIGIIGIIIVGLMITIDIAEFMAKRRSNRHEQCRVFFEILRAEQELHHLSSDAFSSLMEVARSPESSGESPTEDQADDDAN